jgi:hypothetical protein
MEGETFQIPLHLEETKWCAQLSHGPLYESELLAFPTARGDIEMSVLRGSPREMHLDARDDGDNKQEECNYAVSGARDYEIEEVYKKHIYRDNAVCIDNRFDQLIADARLLYHEEAFFRHVHLPEFVERIHYRGRPGVCSIDQAPTTLSHYGYSLEEIRDDLIYSLRLLRCLCLSTITIFVIYSWILCHTSLLKFAIDVIIAMMVEPMLTVVLMQLGVLSIPEVLHSLDASTLGMDSVTSICLLISCLYLSAPGVVNAAMMNAICVLLVGIIDPFARYGSLHEDLSSIPA